MKQQSRGAVLCALLACLVLCFGLIPAAWAQQSQGSVSVIVVDPSGGVIPGAQLKLVDTATNDARQASTQDAGNYTFVNLSFGQYKLTVTKEGFETQTYNVTVQSARNTDVKAALKVGSTQQVVEVVGGAAPLVETTSSAQNLTITTKDIEDLPMGGRNIASFSTLAAGFNGTWNGLPGTAQGNTVDGILGNTSRWRYGGTQQATSTGVTPRLENIAEMTVSTDQLDLNSGWGNSAMHITFVTRRGTNNWHGRLYEDHRNSALNANGWGTKDGTKSKYHLNEFGGSAGGPILKDKLFVFGSYSEYLQPGNKNLTRSYLTPLAEGGTFSYGCIRNQPCPQGPVTVNLYDVAKAYNAANPTATPLPFVINQMVSDRYKQVAGYRASSGGLNITQPDNLNSLTWFWQVPGPTYNYYPTFRVDYNLSQNLRFNLAYNQTKSNWPNANAEHWPGDGRGGDNRANAATASLGVEWTISPTLINQFKGGYLYTANWYSPNATTDFYTKDTINYGWGYGDYYEMPNSRMQPVFSLSDNVTWVKGAHTFSFGGNWYRDQNKYWDPPEGFNPINFSMVSSDPARNGFTATTIQALAKCDDSRKDSKGLCPAPRTDISELSDARSLYANLVGRISGVSGRHPWDPKTGQYFPGVGVNTLNELLKSWGLFAQDSWKLKRNLTLNYGLRWDFVSPDKDLTGKYHTMSPTDLFGPTGIWQLFQPGASSLTGTNDPLQTQRDAAYGSWNVTPSPAIGIAWTPRSNGTFMEKMLGGDKTVVRAGYSFRRFTEPQQFVWDLGSIYAVGFYQTFWRNPSTTPGLGYFYPGSLHLGDKLPDPGVAPLQLDKVLHLKDTTFNSASAGAIDTNIRQPYTQSWNLGIQRELGASRAIEIRYNGNRTLRQWIAQNINEVNIFENGFLDEFKHAQANYNLNHAAGVESFANRGLAGQFNLPIMTAAGVNFADADRINNLKYGQAGSFANLLAGNTGDKNFFCRMVGSTFSPCGSSYGAGQGYPINFWLANPYAIGAWMGAPLMTDKGYSNYNGLQAEFRQRQWHGMNMTANYTWSRTMGVSTSGDWTAAFTNYTNRDLRASYGPTGTDRHHVIHVNATYDLPFGKGKSMLNNNSILDKVVGGWTVSTIVTFQSGSPYRLGGANNTFNDFQNGGVVLNGITPQDFEAHQGLWFDSSNRPQYLDPTWVKDIVSNKSVFANTTPGTIMPVIWLHGPHQTYTDVGISKSATITERFRFKFQTEMLNAFNHPTFGQSDAGVQSQTFGRGSQTASSRRIEFRANLEF